MTRDDVNIKKYMFVFSINHLTLFIHHYLFNHTAPAAAASKQVEIYYTKLAHV